MIVKLESLARSRRLRLAATVSMAAVGLWAFVPYMANEVGGEAWVNAPLTRISSPIAGTVTTALPEPGAHLPKSRAAVLVRARALDTNGLGGLLDQQAAMQAGLELAERQLSEIATADQRLIGRAGRFESAAVARLVATTDAARADAEACTAEAREAQQQLARIETLAARGFATNATQDRARAAASASESRCTALDARLEASLGETRAAREGLYLGASAQDTPYAEQQRDRLMLRRQELETLTTNARAHLAELTRRIASERERLKSASAYQADLPANRIVWRALVSPGETVASGDPLLELADCTHRYVEVTLPERRMEAMQPGALAKIRLIGSNDWMEGRIMGVTGAAASRDAALVAANDKSRDAGALTVAIALPASATSSGARRCDIGRLAEVRFARWGG